MDGVIQGCQQALPNRILLTLKGEIKQLCGQNLFLSSLDWCVLPFRKVFALENVFFVCPSGRKLQNHVAPSYGEKRRYGLGTAVYIPEYVTAIKPHSCVVKNSLNQLKLGKNAKFNNVKFVTILV
jgi:hypothetical protein